MKKCIGPLLSGFAVQNHPGPLTTISELNMIDIAHIANNRVL
jgi:hypothetical protein